MIYSLFGENKFWNQDQTDIRDNNKNVELNRILPKDVMRSWEVKSNHDESKFKIN